MERKIRQDKKTKQSNNPDDKVKNQGKKLNVSVETFTGKQEFYGRQMSSKFI